MKQNHNSPWLLLTYKVPPEPTRVRVGIWRRIRGLGAIYLQNGICVLPASNEHRRQLRLVQSDIEGAGGEAWLFETLGLDTKQEARVVSQFKQDREQDYAEFLERCDGYKRELESEVKAGNYTFAEVKENEEDLKKLKNWLVKIRALDFYDAPARAAAETRLKECDAMLEAYAKDVFEREQSIGRPASTTERVPAPRRAAKKTR